jgi:hypothetical protein
MSARKPNVAWSQQLTSATAYQTRAVVSVEDVAASPFYHIWHLGKFDFFFYWIFQSCEQLVIFSFWFYCFPSGPAVPQLLFICTTYILVHNQSDTCVAAILKLYCQLLSTTSSKVLSLFKINILLYANLILVQNTLFVEIK